MLIFEYLAEQRLQEAIARGEFSNLPGAGKPLSLDEPPAERKEDRIALHVLRRSGFLPPALALRKAFEQKLQQAEQEMAPKLKMLSLARQNLRQLLPAEPEKARKILAELDIVVHNPGVEAFCQMKVSPCQTSPRARLVAEIKKYHGLHQKAREHFLKRLHELKDIKSRAEAAKIHFEISHHRNLNLPELTFAAFEMQMRNKLAMSFLPLPFSSESEYVDGRKSQEIGVSAAPLESNTG